MVYGYIRVSTDKQSDNNSFPVQESAILEKYPDARIFSEAYTATNKGTRKVFKEVIEMLHESDTLVVAKMDRFARSVKAGVSTVEELLEKGVTVDILNIGRLDNTPTGKLMYTTLLAYAEFEASLIAERTKAGRDRVRADNPDMKWGRPNKYTSEQISHALSLLSSGLSYSLVAKKTGISISTLTRAKRKRV
ncbi:recombinase family protein [Fusibacter ferrireducens]|uniref:Recombinase family protein n=1 Tax=Fusibacter ferrireducens TaxID=2785058 RepID=A0ABR9ZYQ1_9FIRM|nr:recombinase family protein [Fusibacter ferrireducens]MBF4695086.1 recombinase family protein [Fusibacter ferrireducens]